MCCEVRDLQQHEELHVAGEEEDIYLGNGDDSEERD
jgi:hypothetical protein